jgi:class 3 adenylate cyclase
MLGDGAMLHFVSASEAVGSVVEIIERLREAGIPGHAGIHAGPVIEHDGDYYGQTVNLASRVACVAMNGEIAITDAIRSTLIEPKWSIEPRGEVELRGAGEPIGLHVIRVDPVVSAADDS